MNLVGIKDRSMEASISRSRSVECGHRTNEKNGEQGKVIKIFISGCYP